MKKKCMWKSCVKEALFITAKKWKQPNCPTCDINKQEAINGMPLNNKRIKVLIHTTSWRNFKTPFSVKKSQMQKTTYSMITFMWNMQKRQIYKDRTELTSCLRLGDGIRINCNRHMRFFSGDWYVLELESSGESTSL